MNFYLPLNSPNPFKITPNFTSNGQDHRFIGLPLHETPGLHVASTNNTRRPNIQSRRRFTNVETRVLSSFFEKNTRPSTKEREQLARQLNMPVRSVQIWFQNRRAKIKRSNSREWDSSRESDSSSEIDTADQTISNFKTDINLLSLDPSHRVDSSIKVPTRTEESKKPLPKISTRLDALGISLGVPKDSPLLTLDVNELFDESLWLSAVEKSGNNGWEYLNSPSVRMPIRMEKLHSATGDNKACAGMGNIPVPVSNSKPPENRHTAILRP